MTAEPLVYIVDDEASIRSALGRLFSSVGLQSRGFADATEFLARPSHDGPECVVLDIRMPAISGLDLQHELNHMGVGTPIIFLTAHGDVPITVRAMKAGAIELLTKPVDDKTLIDAVRHALDLDRSRRSELEELRALQKRFDTLTARERQVMALVVTGLLNKQVAGMLGTAEKTIKVHRARAMKKMDATSLAHLVRMADRLKLPPPPSE